MFCKNSGTKIDVIKNENIREHYMKNIKICIAFLLMLAVLPLFVWAEPYMKDKNSANDYNHSIGEKPLKFSNYPEWFLEIKQRWVDTTETITSFTQKGKNYILYSSKGILTYKRVFSKDGHLMQLETKDNSFTITINLDIYDNIDIIKNIKGSNGKKSISNEYKGHPIAGINLLHEAIRNDFTPFLYAVIYDAPDVTEFFIENGSNVNTTVFIEEADLEATLVHTAALYGAYDVVRLLITKYGIDIDKRDNQGNTPLMYPNYLRGADIADFLIKNGADVNAKNDFGETPLMRVTFVDADKTAEVLIKNGADINARNNSGETPLMYAAQIDAFIVAITLIENGADINAKDDNNETPLIHALYAGSYNTLEYLITSGANVNVKDRHGHTALEIAKLSGVNDIIELLKKYGAK